MKTKFFIICTFLLWAFNSIALEESGVVSEIKNAVLNGRKCDVSGRTSESFWKPMKVKTRIHVKYWKKGDYYLHFSKFGCGLGRYGSVVIAPGRTEASVEYYETAIDYVNRGFSPVYVIDHVAQGFSPRLLEDGHKGHVSRFSDYIDAFDTAVRGIEGDLLRNEGRTDQALFFTSNSMGGAIGIGYFQKMGDENPFAAAALLGPMIKINYLGFPGAGGSPNGIKRPIWWQKLKYSELVVILQAHVLCKILPMRCREYATKLARDVAAQYGSAFLEGQRDFDKAWAVDPEQVMTHSKARYNLRTILWEAPEVKSVYKRMGLRNPQLGAPTVQWVKQAAKFNVNMIRSDHVSKMSDMPLKIITGTRDVRAYTSHQNGSTDLDSHVDFCNLVNSLKGEGTCDFLPIAGGFHEIYKESRQYRRQGFDAAVEHFLKAL